MPKKSIFSLFRGDQITFMHQKHGETLTGKVQKRGPIEGVENYEVQAGGWIWIVKRESPNQEWVGALR